MGTRQNKQSVLFLFRGLLPILPAIGRLAYGTDMRLPLEPPKMWGYTDDQLAAVPLVFREDALQGQVCLISGGGSGIGRGIAYVLSRLGAEIAICGRRVEKLEETASGMRRLLGKDAMFKPMSIRDPEEVETLIGEVWARFGRLDHLVNCAGGQYPQAAIDFSVKGWNAIIDTNLNGSWYMMQSAARRWRDRTQSGSIVNIVAVVNRGMPQVAHTAAARAGVIYLSKTLSVEWAPLGIRVNCVAPGSIATDGLNVYPRDAAESFVVSNPMKRLGDVVDIAQSVAYLASASGKFITGETVHVDGGRQNWGEDWPGGIPDYYRVTQR